MSRELYPLKTSRKLRSEAAALAVQAKANIEGGPAMVFALCIFFERYLAEGADRTQDALRIFDEERAEIIVLQGGKGAPEA